MQRLPVLPLLNSGDTGFFPGPQRRSWSLFENMLMNIPSQQKTSCFGSA
jgi:hypothetical protein